MLLLLQKHQHKINSEMHDIIFSKMRERRSVDLIKYAAKLGLNIQQFEADFEQNTLKSKTDFESGDSGGVNGTPSFFINSWKI